MIKTFSTPLHSISDALTFVAMAGLTLASAAALAVPVHEAEAEVVYLPTVVVTANSTHAEPVRLPTVVVVAKRTQSDT